MKEHQLMSQRVIFSLLILLSYSSCNNEDTAAKKHTVVKVSKKNIVIDLQPFEGISPDQTQYVYTEFKRIYTFIEIKKTIALPQSAYYRARNRYRADSIINILSSRAASGHKIIGLTNKDISTTSNGIVDWGVMGLGFCPGKACIASAFRLSKKEINMQLFKVAIHELGHTFGLPHCKVKSCFMRDAEGGNPTSEEKEFCIQCKTYLINKGWILN